MKLIKTTLVALIAIIGFSSNAQETKTSNETLVKKEMRVSRELKVAEFKLSPEQIATHRADELKTKVELTAEQYAKVKELFLKVENRKSAINNVSEEEKTNALNNLQKMENDELETILTPTQKKIVSSPKTENKASNM